MCRRVVSIKSFSTEQNQARKLGTSSQEYPNTASVENKNLLSGDVTTHWEEIDVASSSLEAYKDCLTCTLFPPDTFFPASSESLCQLSQWIRAAATRLRCCTSRRFLPPLRRRRD